MGIVINKYTNKTKHFLCSKCSFEINSNRVFFLKKGSLCVSINLFGKGDTYIQKETMPSFVSASILFDILKPLMNTVILFAACFA